MKFSFFRCILFLIAGFGLLPAKTFAQQSGCKLQISLLTCGPGDELYATFGHSAVRVYDSLSQNDYVFNYGTFDFDDPHFYEKFIRGKLLYSLSAEDFRSQIGEWQEENRKVTEQVLDLSCEEKEALWRFLQTNYLPQNRLYKYDFVFDNCSTRIRDIFSNTFGSQWKTANVLPQKEISFRQIINQYLEQKPWEKLGINLLFGERMDKKMTNTNIMFLPDFLMKGIAHSSLNGKPLVRRTAVLYLPRGIPGTDRFQLTPLFLFMVCCGILIILSFSKRRQLRQFLSWVDRFLFFITGLLGCFMLFMWIGTDHQVCKWNLNLLWALPTHLIFSFLTDKRTGWVKGYAAFTALTGILLLAGWYFLPQELPAAVLPLLILLILRGYRIYTRPAPAW